jgi:hypothetical protein
MAKRNRTTKKTKTKPKVAPPHVSTSHGFNLSLQGVAEVMDTKLARQVYREGLQNPLKAGSAVTTKIIEGLNLFAAPFAYLGRFVDRLMVDLEKCRQKVPPERQVESPPEIAGPIIQQLRFTSEENPLREVFLNLLTSSIDKDRQGKIHPAFVTILQQISPDEAQVINGICESPTARLAVIHGFAARQKNARMTEGYEVFRLANPTLINLAFPERLAIYVNRLVSFTLIINSRANVETSFQVVEGERLENVRESELILTPFGRLFAECIGVTRIGNAIIRT